MLNENVYKREVIQPPALTHKPIPGPRGNPFFGSLVRFSRRDPLRFMIKLAREYGDVSTFRLGVERVVFVNNPEYVRDVLVNYYDNFLKGAGNQCAKRFLQLKQLNARARKSALNPNQKPLAKMRTPSLEIDSAVATVSPPG